MSYDAAAYWSERRRRHGENYVARGGRGTEFVREYDRVAPLLAQLVEGATNVLDYGCGVQRFRPVLERIAGTYTGMDLLPSDRSYLLTHEFAPDSFDAIVATYVFQHIVDDGELMATVQRLYDWLRPDGRLIVVDYDLPMKNPDPHMASRYSYATLLALHSWSMSVKVDEFEGHWVGYLVK
jgi:SAM-dependent methyltransferase